MIHGFSAGEANYSHSGGATRWEGVLSFRPALLWVEARHTQYLSMVPAVIRVRQHDETVFELPSDAFAHGPIPVSGMGLEARTPLVLSGAPVAPHILVRLGGYWASFRHDLQTMSTVEIQDLMVAGDKELRRR